MVYYRKDRRKTRFYGKLSDKQTLKRIKDNKEEQFDRRCQDCGDPTGNPGHIFCLKCWNRRGRPSWKKKDGNLLT
jgi:hypothetical protein